MPQDFVCIYCKIAKPEDQRSKEHLLQRSLGGDLTAQFVCASCNAAFSKIDQSLSDRSAVALSRVAYTPTTAHRVKSGGIATYFDGERGIFIEVELRNQLTAVVLPQLHLRPDGRGEFIATDKASLEQVIQFINQHFTAGTIESVHRFHGLPNRTATSTAALVVRKRGDGYIRLPTASDAGWYFPVLKFAWEHGLESGLAGANPIQKEGKFPEVRLDVTFAPNDILRAVAKTAFNVLAFKRGPEFVLRPEFDPIRNYILGELILPDVSGTGDIAVDERFVKEIVPDQQQIRFVDEGHAIVFCYLHPELVGFVTLYGSHLFLVRFPSVEYAEPDGLFGHRFSIDRTGNEPMELLDIIEGLIERDPGRYGLNPQQVTEMVKNLRARDPVDP